METSRWAESKPKAEPPSADSVATPQTSNVETQPATVESVPPPPPPPPDTGFAPPDNTDEFAQTISQDDLFGDDFTPIAEPTIEEVIPQQPVEPTPQQSKEQRGRGRGGFRGRGGRGRGTNNNQGRSQAQNQEVNSTEAEEPTPLTVNGNRAPTGPKGEPVRGDRHLSGGLVRARLTEDELNARLEAIKLKNASLEAAHARAAADEASFHAREAEAEEQRKKERKERQQMMSDRERNRIRKLNAQQGREWDAVKEDERGNEVQSRGSAHRRGAHGGIAGVAPTSDDRDRPGDYNEGTEQYMWHEDSQGRGRGRGRGRGGRGRGTYNTRGGSQQSIKQDVPSAEDFPALAPTQKAGEEIHTPGWPVQTKAAGSWADEMDSPVTPNVK